MGALADARTSFSPSEKDWSVRRIPRARSSTTTDLSRRARQDRCPSAWRVSVICVCPSGDATDQSSADTAAAKRKTTAGAILFKARPPRLAGDDGQDAMVQTRTRPAWAGRVKDTGPAGPPAPASPLPHPPPPPRGPRGKNHPPRPAAPVSQEARGG